VKGFTVDYMKFLRKVRSMDTNIVIERVKLKYSNSHDSILPPSIRIEVSIHKQYMCLRALNSKSWID